MDHVEAHTCRTAAERSARLDAARIVACEDFQCVEAGCEERTREQYEINGDWHVPLCAPHQLREILEKFYPPATG